MTATLRAFVGIPAGATLARGLSAVRAGFAGGAIRWVPAENLHLTLKFLGNVEEAAVAAMCSALRQALRDTAPFPVAARGLGVFPDARRPRILWIGLAAPDLEALAGRVERALASLGIEQSPGPFRPHVTVGRWRRPEPRGPSLREALARWQDHAFGEFRVDEVTLFRSTLRPAGAEYSALEVFSLKPGVEHAAAECGRKDVSQPL